MSTKMKINQNPWITVIHKPTIVSYNVKIFHYSHYDDVFSLKMFIKVQSIKKRRILVENVLVFEIAAFSRH